MIYVAMHLNKFGLLCSLIYKDTYQISILLKLFGMMTKLRICYGPSSPRLAREELRRGGREVVAARAEPVAYAGGGERAGGTFFS